MARTMCNMYVDTVWETKHMRALKRLVCQERKQPDHALRVYENESSLSYIWSITLLCSHFSLYHASTMRSAYQRLTVFYCGNEMMRLCSDNLFWSRIPDTRPFLNNLNTNDCEPMDPRDRCIWKVTCKRVKPIWSQKDTRDIFVSEEDTRPCPGHYQQLPFVPSQ